MKHFDNMSNFIKVMSSLSHPIRLRIINELINERKYVSQLARDLEIGRSLINLHLKKLEDSGLINGYIEILEDGKIGKYYEVVFEDIFINKEVIIQLVEKEIKK